MNTDDAVLGPDYESPFDTPKKPCLRGKKRTIAVAIVDAMAPRDEKFNIDLSQEVTNHMDHFVGFLPSYLRIGFPWVLVLFDFLAVFKVRRRFHKIKDTKMRYQILQAWTTSRWLPARELLKAFRAIVMSGYYSHSAYWEEIGYAPDAYVQTLIKQRAESYGSQLERNPI